MISIRALATCALLAIQAWVAFANADITSSEELVNTPAGLVPKSNVHAVPEGAHVHHNSTHVQLIAADGTIIHSAPVSAKVSTRPKFTETNITAIAPRNLETGYVAYSYWKNTSPSNIASFSTTWTVPPAPQTQDGQLLYIFNGLVPTSLDGILQPVLQFGVSPAGGGNYWAVASWYLVGAAVYYGAPAQVYPGQSLTGVMTLKSTTISGTTTNYHWNTAFTGVAGVAMSISTTEVYTYAYEALEIYSATGAPDLPKGQTTMGNINITLADGTHPSMLNWTPVSDSNDGFSIAIVSNASTSGALQITYPTH